MLFYVFFKIVQDFRYDESILMKIRVILCFCKIVQDFRYDESILMKIRVILCFLKLFKTSGMMKVS